MQWNKTFTGLKRGQVFVFSSSHTIHSHTPSHLPLPNQITTTSKLWHNYLMIYGPRMFPCTRVIFFKSLHVLNCGDCCLCNVHNYIYICHTHIHTHHLPHHTRGQLKHNTRWVNHFAVVHTSPVIFRWGRGQEGHLYGHCIKQPLREHANSQRFKEIFKTFHWQSLLRMENQTRHCIVLLYKHYICKFPAALFLNC